MIENQIIHQILEFLYIIRFLNSVGERLKLVDRTLQISLLGSNIPTMRNGKHLALNNIILSLLDLNAALEAMVQKEGDGRYSCLQCGKNMADKSMIKRHAETHLNMAHPCIVCQKMFKTRSSLAMHYKREHPNEVISRWTMQ